MRRKTIKISDLINVLTQYNLEHAEFPIEYTENDHKYLGVANDVKKVLYINKNISQENKREAVIHELIHGVHYMRGDLDDIDDIEEVVDRETKSCMKRYFKEDL